MPSAAEQLASSVNFGAIAKATELKQRIIFTLLALIVYRLGTYIPIPGINPGALDDILTKILVVSWECLICSQEEH